MIGAGRGAGIRGMIQGRVAPRARPAIKLACRTIATRTYSLREVSATADTRNLEIGPRELVDAHSLVPRDLRLLSRRSWTLAARENHFIFRFPPLTGCVSHDRVLLIADDSAPATKALERRILEQVATTQQQLRRQEQQASVHRSLAPSAALGRPVPPPPAPFEHMVLEAALSESTMHKQDRYARLSLLTRAALDDNAQQDGDTIWSRLFSSRREAALYRLLTLNDSLSSLEVDVKRAHSTLLTLLASDEDMESMYLTHRARHAGARRPTGEHKNLELLLESYATDHEDLRDRIAALQESVSTHRLREELRLSNERNRIMRAELLLTFSTTSLALCAAVAGFFGMNLHSGVEEVPHMLWVVTGSAALASTALFGGLLMGVRRFHVEQMTQIARTASLESSLSGLDAAYYALRVHGLLEDMPERTLGSAPSQPRSVISKAVLSDALHRSEATPPTTQQLEDLWALLDTNADGELQQEEVESLLHRANRASREGLARFGYQPSQADAREPRSEPPRPAPAPRDASAT